MYIENSNGKLALNRSNVTLKNRKIGITSKEY